jgi:hypothetical protein
MRSSSTLFFSLLAALVLGACATDTTPTTTDAGPESVDAGAPSIDAAPAPRDITFVADVWPILNRECQGCHFVTDNPPQIFDAVPTHTRLVGGASPTAAGIAWIEPGDPERSYLYLKISDGHRAAGGAGDRMPPPSVRGSLLPEADRELVRAWIAAGAPLE